MNGKDGNPALQTGPGSATDPSHHRAQAGENSPSRLNWVLALLTVPGAAIVMLFALEAVMSTDSCGGGRCPKLGDGISFDVLFYGPPMVALFVIVISLFTAKRRGGIAVPLGGLALLVTDVAILAATVAHS